LKRAMEWERVGPTPELAVKMAEMALPRVIQAA
jgi:hypothetical protein